MDPMILGMLSNVCTAVSVAILVAVILFTRSDSYSYIVVQTFDDDGKLIRTEKIPSSRG